MLTMLVAKVRYYRLNPRQIPSLPFTGSIDTGFSGIKTTVNEKEIDLGVTFTDGLANPEINKKTGEIIYIDNRPLIQRDSRQKEDVKIILEF